MKKNGRLISSQATSRSGSRQKAAGAANLARYKAKNPRPAIRHGIDSFLAGGPLPAEIQAKLEAFKAGLHSDLAGDVSTAEKALIDSSKTALAVICLAFRWLAQNDVVDARGKPAGLLRTLATYMNTLRLNLCALGLRRRSKDAMTLDSVLAEYREGGKGGEAAPANKA